jgi:uncharacterized repeat protein (TIGR03803 family)
MKSLDFGRCALSMCVVAVMLAACGGSGPPLSPSPAWLGAVRTSSTGSYRLLYSFGGYSADAENPDAPLTNVNGTLYGTTINGGAHGDGAVFAVTKSGKEAVFYSFNGPAGDGENPLAGFIAVNSTLYGTTSYGGAKDDGTVFTLTPSGKERVIHSFRGGADGAYLADSLIDVMGTLYGTTYEGGRAGGCYTGCGTVFAITTAGKETVIHGFDGQDGSEPQSGLIAFDGGLYGTTYGGGAADEGTVFSIATSGAETVLHSFGDIGDGANPRASLVNVKGALYGTTQGGGAHYGGTVFRITTSGKETVIHSFGGAGDGAYPFAGLINVKGTLYGTTSYGGAYGGPNGGGTVFKITTSGSETVLHSFGASGDGSRVNAALINVKGTLYGTTDSGGTNCISLGGCGTAFSLTP